MADSLEACLPVSENFLPETALRTSKAGIVNLGVFLGVLILGTVIYFSPLRAWLADAQAIRGYLSQFGYAAPLVFVLATGLSTALGTPRLLLCSVAGMVFGFGWGMVWSQLGTLLGSYATFLLVRRVGKDYALSHWPRLQGFSRYLASRSLMAVVLIRQLPISGFHNNLILGLAPVGHVDFLLGSLLGFLPLGLTACLLGAGLIQSNWVQGMQYLLLGLACSVVLGYGLKRWVNSSQRVDHDLV